jgi:hypothetical protein
LELISLAVSTTFEGTDFLEKKSQKLFTGTSLASK